MLSAGVTRQLAPLSPEFKKKNGVGRIIKFDKWDVDGMESTQGTHSKHAVVKKHGKIDEHVHWKCRWNIMLLWNYSGTRKKNVITFMYWLHEKCMLKICKVAMFCSVIIFL